MTVSSFSQLGYPRKIKIGADSAIAITYSQMTFMNETHVRMIGYERINDSLAVLLKKWELLYINGQTLIEGLKSEVVTQKDIAGKNEELANKNYALYEDEKKKSKRLKAWMGIGGGAAGATILGLLIGFLAK